MSSEKYISYRHFLAHELKARQEQNRGYSLRTLARDLKVRSSRLSEILNGKVGISERRAIQIAEALHLPEDEKNIFVDLVQSVHGRGTLTKRMASERLRQKFPQARQIQLDEFEAISDWYHAALIELLQTADFDGTPTFIAKRLGISEQTVVEAIDRLTRLGLLVHEGEQLKMAERNRSTTNNVPSSAIRTYHRQIMSKAEKALENQPVEDRDFLAVTFSMNRSQVQALKDLLAKFRQELKSELDHAIQDPKDAVYCLSAQLFELTERV